MHNFSDSVVEHQYCYYHNYMTNNVSSKSSFRLENAISIHLLRYYKINMFKKYIFLKQIFPVVFHFAIARDFKALITKIDVVRAKQNVSSVLLCK